MLFRSHGSKHGDGEPKFQASRFQAHFPELPRVKALSIRCKGGALTLIPAFLKLLSMKISLAPALEKFVTRKVQSGDYDSASEVVRDALRRWKESEALESEWLEDRIGEALAVESEPLTASFFPTLKQKLRKELKARKHN